MSHLREALTNTHWGSRLLSKRIPFLAYHSISNDHEDELSLSSSMFSKQIAWLKENNYQAISLENACLKIRHKEDLRRCIVLTFDDGYADVMENALPVLEKYSFTATIFAVTGRLGSKSDWHRFSPSRWLLTEQDLGSLLGAGFTIGSHTHTHAELTRLDDSALIEELCRSRSFLQDRLGISACPFSYPYRSTGARERQAVVQAGYACASTTGGYWGNGCESDLFQLGRFEIRRHTLHQFQAIVTSPFKGALIREGLSRVISSWRAHLLSS